MSKSLDRMRVDLEIRNYATKTQRHYWQAVRLFGRHFDRDPGQAVVNDHG